MFGLWDTHRDGWVEGRTFRSKESAQDFAGSQRYADGRPYEYEVRPRRAVLSLCDKTGNMVRPWADAGYQCYAVDITNGPGERLVAPNLIAVGADVHDWLPPRLEYAACFAFPPCTDLAVAGAKHLKDKGLAALAGALAVVERCRQVCEWSGAPWMLENPVSTLSTYWREPDFIFNPCEYAGYLDDPATEAYTKRTCLWTGGGFVMPPARGVEPVGGRKGQPNAWYSRVGGKSQATKDYRSATPIGFARAVFEAMHTAKEAA